MKLVLTVFLCLFSGLNAFSQAEENTKNPEVGVEEIVLSRGDGNLARRPSLIHMVRPRSMQVWGRAPATDYPGRAGSVSFLQCHSGVPHRTWTQETYMKEIFTVTRARVASSDRDTLRREILSHTGSDNEVASILRSLENLANDTSITHFEITPEPNPYRNVYPGAAEAIWKVTPVR